MLHVAKGTAFSLHLSAEAMPASKAMAVAQGRRAELPVSARALGKGHEPWVFLAVGLKAMPSERHSNCPPIYYMQK